MMTGRLGYISTTRARYRESGGIDIATYYWNKSTGAWCSKAGVSADCVVELERARGCLGAV